MSLYYDLEDPEAAQGGGAVVPNGQDIRAVIPEAVAGALPAGSTPATKKEEATGETVINDEAVNPNTGMAQAPLTGAEAAKDFTHDFTHDLLSEDQRKKGANELYDFGMGNDVKTDAVDPLTGTSRTGLPAWYQAAKLRGAKVPGSKNSHYLLDEKTWEPPSENKLGKGIAGMIANMSTAGSRVAMNEKSRPLALRMKDANRVALGEGAGMLADTLFGRKRDRYEDLLKTAKTESEIEKNRATATKGGKGSGSEASRMAALRGALEVDQGKITSDRLEHKDAVANEQARIDADPESPKAEKLRRDIITESAGWLTENEVPHASYADLKMMRPQLGEMVRIKAQRDQARYDNEWKAFHDTHATSTKEYEKWVDDQKKMADRRRDYYLPSNMFWENGVPPSKSENYEAVKTHISQTNTLLRGIGELKKIQQKLQEMNPLVGGGGIVIKTLGKYLGYEEAQALMLRGKQWADELRDIVREKNHFGVPQEWEQELMRSRILEPGDFMAWLQGTKGYDALYEVLKQNGKQWLRDQGVRFEGEDARPKDKNGRDITWTGQAPPILTEPVVHTKDGKIDPTWERIHQTGIENLHQIDEYGHQVLAPADVQKSDVELKEQTAKEPNDPLTSNGNVPAIPGDKPAAKVEGDTAAMTPGFKEFAAFVNNLRSQGKKWSEAAAKSWAHTAQMTGDRMLQAFTKLPFDVQQRMFESDEPFSFEQDKGGNVSVTTPAEPAHSRPFGDKPVEVSGPGRRAAGDNKQPTRWRVTRNGRTIQEIPAGASKEKANAVFNDGLKGVNENERGDYKLEAY